MSNPADIRNAIASTLRTQFGSAWNVSAYLRAKPEPPELNVVFGPVRYDTAMAGGNEDVQCTIMAFVQWGEDIAAQAALDPLIDWTGSTTSLKGALEADRTLGGSVSSIRVVDVTETKEFRTDGGALIGVEFTVEVTPNG